MKWVDIHTHRLLPDNENIWGIYNAIDYQEAKSCKIPFSYGIHPWKLSHFDEFSFKTDYKSLFHDNLNLIAMGEVGLDRVINDEISLQGAIFEEHVHLSEKFRLPIIIHCVKAYSDILYFRKKTKSIQPWIIHGFQSNVKVAQQMIDQGIYLSFGKALSYHTRTQDSLAMISENYIFFETDDEESLRIQDVYKRGADIKGYDIERLRAKCWENKIKVFGH